VGKGGNEGGFATSIPTQAQAFTLPTTTAAIPPQAVMQTHVPTKNMGVKVLLFVVMFAGL